MSRILSQYPYCEKLLEIWPKHRHLNRVLRAKEIHCAPFLWTGAPWETNYGAIIGAIVTPDTNSLEQHRFTAVYDGKKTLNGTIHIHSLCRLNGVWQHHSGASGRFHFKLLHNNAFSGVWTNGSADPLSGAQADNWFGSR